MKTIVGCMLFLVVSMGQAKAEANKPASRGKDIVIQLKGAKGKPIPMTFAACPSGTFRMGNVENNDSACFRHTVKISKNFWLGTCPVTIEQWDAVMGQSEMDEKTLAVGGVKTAKISLSYSRTAKFIEFLNKRHKKSIPPKYVFRLPSEAEWEYALKANCEDPENPYVKYLDDHDESVLPEIAICGKELSKIAAKGGCRDYHKGGYRWPTASVGGKKPNAWGLYDMLGNGREYVLDTFALPELKKAKGRWGRNEYNIGQNMVTYQESETDPVRVAKGDETIFCMSRSWAPEIGMSEDVRFGMGKLLHRVQGEVLEMMTFRVAIGPDIVRAGRSSKPKQARKSK